MSSPFVAKDGRVEVAGARVGDVCEQAGGAVTAQLANGVRPLVVGPGGIDDGFHFLAPLQCAVSAVRDLQAVAQAPQPTRKTRSASSRAERSSSFFFWLLIIIMNDGYSPAARRLAASTVL